MNIRLHPVSESGHMRQTMRTIRDMDRVIKELGGNAEVARLFGVVRSAVANWKMKGYLPPETYRVIAEELEDRDFAVDMGLWLWKPRADNGGKKS